MKNVLVITRQTLVIKVDFLTLLAVLASMSAINSPVKAATPGLPDFCATIPAEQEPGIEGIDPEIPRSLKCAPPPRALYP